MAASSTPVELLLEFMRFVLRAQIDLLLGGRHSPCSCLVPLPRRFARTTCTTACCTFAIGTEKRVHHPLVLRLLPGLVAA